MNTLRESLGPVQAYLPFFLCIAALLAFYLPTYFYGTKFVGTSDSWLSTQDNIRPILSMTLPAGVLLFLGAFCYFWKRPQGIFYFIFALLCAALALSYSSLSIATITKA